MLRSLSNKLRFVSDDDDVDGDGDGDDPPSHGISSSTPNPRRESSAASDEILTRFRDKKSRGIGSHRAAAADVGWREMEWMRNLPEENTGHGYLAPTAEESARGESRRIMGSDGGDEQWEYSRIVDTIDHDDDDDDVDVVDVDDGGGGGRMSFTNLDSSLGRASSMDGSMVCRSPFEMLEWLGGEGEDCGSGTNYIAISEDRAMELLRALKQSGRLQETVVVSRSKDWVPTERLREVERRRRVAEERLEQYMSLVAKVDEAPMVPNARAQDLLSKQSIIKGHLEHISKFVEDSQKDLGKHYVLAGEKRDGGRMWHRLSTSTTSGDDEQMYRYRRCVDEICSIYDEITILLASENSRRLEVERRNGVIIAQIKKQTDQLRRAEDVIKRVKQAKDVLAAPDCIDESIDNDHRILPGNQWAFCAQEHAEVKELDGTSIQGSNSVSNPLLDCDLLGPSVAAAEEEESEEDLRPLHQANHLDELDKKGNAEEDEWMRNLTKPCITSNNEGRIIGDGDETQGMGLSFEMASAPTISGNPNEAKAAEREVKRRSQLLLVQATLLVVVLTWWASAISSWHANPPPT